MELDFGLDQYYKGKCSCCHQWSQWLIKGDGRCIDCVEEEKFEEQNLKIKQNEIRD